MARADGLQQVLDGEQAKLKEIERKVEALEKRVSEESTRADTAESERDVLQKELAQGKMESGVRKVMGASQATARLKLEAQLEQLRRAAAKAEKDREER
eukprot:CAMPEP_0170154410 /NCGR_PEP_ID=MMETSP0033_2-20121228/57803_1 /TAXON_ID=195969 /ORGANISM="Dolichomastix tenuilepis, Strain CCMP3274" /LENGTH=98 /DNA_ID=CAMNT_0010391655 /DNA_START=1 /DNA_END=294 /DNA_ORIENTATION=-